MSNAKHTPGPWTWGEGWCGLYGSGPDNAVLDFEPYEGMWLSWIQSKDVAEANARLIAAAPELLEALKELVEAYERAGPGLSRAERAVDRMRLIEARAAIAKATGEQA